MKGRLGVALGALVFVLFVFPPHQLTRSELHIKSLKRSLVHERAHITFLEESWEALRAPERMKRLARERKDLRAPRAEQKVRIEEIPLRGSRIGARVP